MSDPIETGLPYPQEQSVPPETQWGDALRKLDMKNQELKGWFASSFGEGDRKVIAPRIDFTLRGPQDQLISGNNLVMTVEGPKMIVGKIARGARGTDMARYIIRMGLPESGNRFSQEVTHESGSDPEMGYGDQRLADGSIAKGLKIGFSDSQMVIFENGAEIRNVGEGRRWDDRVVLSSEINPEVAHNIMEESLRFAKWKLDVQEREDQEYADTTLSQEAKKKQLLDDIDKLTT